LKLFNNIKNSNLFRSFIIFSIFRFFYGFFVLFVSYFFTTEYEDGIYITIVFLIRLILTWYPKIELNKGLWLLISIPSSSILNLTRKLIPPIGGVDVGPVIWIGVISFLREILVGQQGLIKLALHTHIT